MKKPLESIDIIIPTHKKDLQILEYCIAAAKEKVVGVGRVIVISRERYSENAEWFDEKLFPFSMESIQEIIGGTYGWYYQQLLKFYAPLVIPNISENVLVLDSDTVFFRQVEMLDEEGRALCNVTRDNNPNRSDFDQRVAAHTAKILPELALKNLPSEFQNVSGISHMMIFNREILRDLFAKVEKHHGGDEPFYKIFLKLADTIHSASEYQIYFNFLLIYHKEKIRVRKLSFKNTSDINIKKYRSRLKYHYCSFHSYLRGSRSNSARVKLAKLAQNFIRKFFYFEIYNIGISNCLIGEFLNLPNRKINWLKHKKFAISYSNPSGFISATGEKNIFAERKNLITGEMKICTLQLNEKLEIIYEKEILRDHDLLQIFDQNFALVKNHKTSKISLCKVNDGVGFERILDLPENLKINHPSITKHNERWWLFFAKSDGKNNELHLVSSDNLLSGKWETHPNSPTILDVGSNHAAGNIFTYHGTSFRPSKNSNNSVWLNRIGSLAPEVYAENKEMEIFPDQLGSWPNGTCSITALGDHLTLLSGKKFSFFPLKPLIFLFRFRLCNANKCWAN